MRCVCAVCCMALCVLHGVLCVTWLINGVVCVAWRSVCNMALCVCCMAFCGVVLCVSWFVPRKIKNIHLEKYPWKKKGYSVLTL